MRRRSLIFRYTLAHATLFVCVLSSALAFLYLSTLEAHQTRQDAALQSEAEDLHRSLEGLTSVREMAAVVTRRTTGQPGATTVYMLATSTRQYVAGNLNRMLDRITTLMTAMREVTDDIAHDMRSPISRLRSRIEVALMSRGDEAVYRRALEQTIADADAILVIFNSLLTIAHAESGEPRKNFRSVDAAAIVADAVDIYEPAAEEAGLDLTYAPGPPALLQG